MLDALRSELGETHECVERWTTARTRSACEHFEPADGLGRAIFVKQFVAADAGQAERVARLLQSLGESVGARDADDRCYLVPHLTSFGDSPPYIAYEWTEGEQMTSTFRSRTALSSRDDAFIVGAARRVGRALAQLHGDVALVVSHDLPIERPRWAAWLAATHLLPRRTVPAIIDVGPWNVVLHDDRSPTFIDLDIERRREVEFDVGWFASALLDRCHRLPLRTALGIVSSFIDGYRETSGVRVSRSLVYLSAAVSGVTRNTVRLRRLRPTGSDRRWILRRLGESFVLIPYGIAQALRGRTGRGERGS